ncbi:MAG: acyl-ACP desaturase [Acidimicrobiia bacterium]
MDDSHLIAELEPIAAEQIQRHLSTTKEWFPHAMVPWSRGRDFVEDETWDPTECPLPDAVRSALFVNLLTEDNLPYYYRTISEHFGRVDSWGEWSRRWTAEEQRHAIVIRDYLTVTRAIDPVALERARMTQVSGGQVPEPTYAIEVLAYVALQELATRISHRNTGKMLEDPVGFQIMSRVAADENLHHLFYRDLVTAALAIDASTTVIAIDNMVRDFQMPGVGIPGFSEHAKAIAQAGIYNFSIHYEQILAPIVLRQWRLADLVGLSGEAEAARERTIAHLAKMERIAQRIAERDLANANA